MLSGLPNSTELRTKHGFGYGDFLCSHRGESGNCQIKVGRMHLISKDKRKKSRYTDYAQILLAFESNLKLIKLHNLCNHKVEYFVKLHRKWKGGSITQDPWNAKAISKLHLKWGLRDSSGSGNGLSGEVVAIGAGLETTCWKCSQDCSKNRLFILFLWLVITADDQVIQLSLALDGCAVWFICPFLLALLVVQTWGWWRWVAGRQQPWWARGQEAEKKDRCYLPWKRWKWS